MIINIQKKIVQNSIKETYTLIYSYIIEFNKNVLDIQNQRKCNIII